MKPTNKKTTSIALSVVLVLISAGIVLPAVQAALESSAVDGTITGSGVIAIDGIIQGGTGGENPFDGTMPCLLAESQCELELIPMGGGDPVGRTLFCMEGGGEGPPTSIRLGVTHTLTATGAYFLMLDENYQLLGSLNLGDPTSPFYHEFTDSDFAWLAGVGDGHPYIGFTNASYPNPGAPAAYSDIGECDSGGEEWSGCPEGESQFCTFNLTGTSCSGTGIVCLGGGGGGPPTSLTMQVETDVEQSYACVVSAVWPEGESYGSGVVTFPVSDGDGWHQLESGELSLFSHEQMQISAYVYGEHESCSAANICSGE